MGLLWEEKIEIYKQTAFMRIKNSLLVVWACILFTGCTSDKKCDYSGETAQVIPKEIIISLPNGWHLSDSSYIVSPGLIDAKTYSPSDSSGYFTIDYYDLSSDSTLVNHDLLLKKQISMLRRFLKGPDTQIRQKEKVIGDYRATVIQGLYFDSSIQKQVVLCLGLVEGGGKYSELILRREGRDRDGLQQINCIMESLRR